MSQGTCPRDSFDSFSCQVKGDEQKDEKNDDNENDRQKLSPPGSEGTGNCTGVFTEHAFLPIRRDFPPAIRTESNDVPGILVRQS